MEPFLWRLSNARQFDNTTGDTNEHNNPVDLPSRLRNRTRRQDLTPIQVQEISAQQSIFSCRCLFYLLRQAAISEPHDPLFNPLLFLHTLEQVTMIGESLSNAAYSHVESLASLKTNKALHKK